MGNDILNIFGKLGARGEKLVRKSLEGSGYSVLETNYRTPFGEIDIIAHNDNYIAFIEVKTRRNTQFSHPCEAITYNKRQHIRHAVQYYLSQYPSEKQPRFDVAEVLDDGENIKINIIENAFSGSEDE